MQCRGAKITNEKRKHFGHLPTTNHQDQPPTTKTTTNHQDQPLTTYHQDQVSKRITLRNINKYSFFNLNRHSNEFPVFPPRPRHFAERETHPDEFLHPWFSSPVSLFCPSSLLGWPRPRCNTNNSILIWSDLSCVKGPRRVPVPPLVRLFCDSLESLGRASGFFF